MTICLYLLSENKKVLLVKLRLLLCANVSEKISPMMEVNSSGAELPAAMKVAPATSSLRDRRWGKETVTPHKSILYL